LIPGPWREQWQAYINGLSPRPASPDHSLLHCKHGLLKHDLPAMCVDAASGALKTKFQPQEKLYCIVPAAVMEKVLERYPSCASPASSSSAAAASASASSAADHKEDVRGPCWFECRSASNGGSSSKNGSLSMMRVLVTTPGVCKECVAVAKNCYEIDAVLDDSRDGPAKIQCSIRVPVEATGSDVKGLLVKAKGLEGVAPGQLLISIADVSIGDGDVLKKVLGKKGSDVTGPLALTGEVLDIDITGATEPSPKRQRRTSTLLSSNLVVGSSSTGITVID